MNNADYIAAPPIISCQYFPPQKVKVAQPAKLYSANITRYTVTLGSNLGNKALELIYPKFHLLTVQCGEQASYAKNDQMC